MPPAASEPPLGSDRNCIQIPRPSRWRECDAASAPRCRSRAGPPRRAKGGGLKMSRVFVACKLFVQSPLVRRGKTLTAVLTREADAVPDRRRTACAASPDRARRLRPPPPRYRLQRRTVGLAGSQRRRLRAGSRSGPCSRKSSTDSDRIPRRIVTRQRSWQVPLSPVDHVPAMRRRCSAGVPYSARFKGDPTQVEVQIVLEGHADTAVHLHAVLQQLRAEMRRCKPWRRSRVRRPPARRGSTAAAAASLMA